MSKRQDYTGYTSTCGTGVTNGVAGTITITALKSNGTNFIYKSFGTGAGTNFSGDFEHTFTFIPTVHGPLPQLFLWALANDIAKAIGAYIAAGTGNFLGVEWFGTAATGAKIILKEGIGASVASSAGTALLTAPNTRYWMRVCRDESVGTYGTLYCWLYSNAAMTELVESIVMTLSAKTDFEYLHAISNWGHSTASTSILTGTIEMLTLEAHPYTLEAMVGYLRTILDEVTAGYFTDAQLKLYINHAIRDIAATSGCIRHIDTATVTSGTRTVAFSGYKCAAVEYTPVSGNPYYLIKINPNQVNHVNTNGLEPQFWYEFGSSIGIEPLPAATYTDKLQLYIEDFPTGDMTVDTEIPQIPPAFQPLIIPKALAQAFMQDNKQAFAQQMLSIYRNELLYTIQDQLPNVPDGTLDLKFE